MPIQFRPFIKRRLQLPTVDCGAGLMVEVAFAGVVFTLVGIGVAATGLTPIRSHPARGEKDEPNNVRVIGRRSPQLERLIPAGRYIRSPGLWQALGFLTSRRQGRFGSHQGYR